VIDERAFSSAGNIRTRWRDEGGINTIIAAAIFIVSFCFCFRFEQVRRKRNISAPLRVYDITVQYVNMAESKHGKMKAIRWEGKPYSMSVKEIEIPKLKGPLDAIVRLTSSASRHPPPSLHLWWR
jgi:hypothetical protein